MVTDARTRAWVCPTCKAAAGARCRIRGNLSDAFHAPRLERARREELGPQEGDPAYLNGSKRRVRGRVKTGDKILITLRESYGPAVDVVDRSRMSWETTPGLWRVT